MLTLIALAHALDADAVPIGAMTGDPTAFTRLGSPATGERGDWDLGLALDYADDPLDEQLPAGRAPVLDALATGSLSAAYSFGGLRLDGAFPIHAGADAGGAFAAPGDAHVGAQLAVPGVSGLALRSVAFLPTGADAHYVGGPPRLLAVGMGAHEFGRLGATVVAGAIVSLPEHVGGLDSSVGPVLGLGAGYRVTDAISAMLEVSAAGEWGLASIPVEAMLSARTRLGNGIWAMGGGGAGIGDGVGASRWRAFVGFGFSRRADAAPDLVVVSQIGLDPNADRDGDGIRDGVDRCPDQAETVDGFDDEDGCPELDGDGDGVTFAKDQCPREPILPEQDPRYSDGCPHIAEMAGDHIAITQTIFFREGRAELLDSADPVLRAVRDQMVAHPDIGMFLIEGHTNSDGSDAYNVRLSDARAYVVMHWLVDHGVASGRLVSKGFGEGRPLAGEAVPNALAINRRVEFRVVHVEDIPAGARRIELPADVR